MGTATINDDGSIRYEMTRNFGLCPKYIFKRTHEPAGSPTHTGDPASSGTQSTGTAATHQVQQALSADDRTQLAAADTLFLASFYPEHGVDATHRGGAPGFVSILDDRSIEIPDYFGNGMFNTFGNLVLDPRLGLTTVDFETGRTIQLTGRAEVTPNTNPELKAERILTLHIERVLVTTALVGTWTDVEASPYNPPVPA